MPNHKPRRSIKFVEVGEDITSPPDPANPLGERIPVRSERAATVARWFGLGRELYKKSGARTDSIASAPIALPDPGTILLITGPSGAGKTRLLNTLRQRARSATASSPSGRGQGEGELRETCAQGHRPHPNFLPEGEGVHAPRAWIDLNSLAAPPLPLVDCFGAIPLRDVLLLLARVGLGEVWTYLRTPAELSEGQRFRLKLALGLHAATTCCSREGQAPAGDFTQPAPILVCDEFAALLDRLTAMIVARCLRRAIDTNPRLSAIVATSHDDLQPALRPDRIAWCDFGRVEVREMRDNA